MNRTVKTNYPVAFDSPDHINPWGTKKDLSRQLRFENKLYQYMEYKKFNKIMDLGCAGGAFISSMNDLGFFAVGLEGSDFSKKNKRGPWAYLSNFVLFTCDITKPFDVCANENEEKQLFDIITSFEVLEHLQEKQIKLLFLNINNHSHDKTKLILSVSSDNDFVNGVNLHQTVKPKNWWISKFNELGWEECKLSMQYFNSQYLRGKRFDTKSNFRVVLKKKNCVDKDIPKLSLLGYMLDSISESKLQKFLFRIVHGDSTYNSY